jgi:hypothetical protein
MVVVVVVKNKVESIKFKKCMDWMEVLVWRREKVQQGPETANHASHAR